MQTNDPEARVFTISIAAKIEALFEMEPKKWFKLMTIPGKPIEETIELTNTRTTPINIEGVTHEFGDQVEAKITTLKEGKSWKLTLRATAQNKEVSAGRVLLKLSGAPIDTFRIPAIVTVQPPEPPER